MTDARPDTASVADRIRPIAAGGAVVAIHFLGETPVFVLGEESVVLAPRAEAERVVSVHDGAILAAAVDDARVVTGGDDGKVVGTTRDGSTMTIAMDPNRRWIDRVAAGADGAVAWSAGKRAFVRTSKGEERTCEVSSTVGGLAFAPKGFRLAIAHYNGATLWFPNALQAAPEKLEWKGSHLDVTFSPDGRFLVTAMQEPALHGWRLADGRHMRMSGYAAKVQSMAWTAGGRWLATSGSDQLILWPFDAKEGPMGKAPLLLAPAGHKVSTVASHPKQEVVAVGYEDGLVLLVRIQDGAEIIAKRPGRAPVSAIAWSATGDMLAFGSEDGESGIIDLA
ncbi:MAG: WD40 repeat domain-containing protein [Bradyrhizobiaceae bacterium]|nr:WD40 repeat domain-containing protein [Bradyrhizobiaceae bacterium]